MSELYVVRGAKAECSSGTKITSLNLPESHGLYVNEKPVLIDTDTVAGVNIIPFGLCKKTRKPCKPMLAKTWKETQEDALINGHPAVITKSVLSCKNGTITIVTDGQS